MAKNFLQSVAKNLKKQPRDVALQRERIAEYVPEFEGWMEYEDGHNKAYNQASGLSEEFNQINQRYTNDDPELQRELKRCDDRWGDEDFDMWNYCRGDAFMEALERAKFPTNEDIQLDPQMYIEHFDPVVRDRAKMFINGED